MPKLSHTVYSTARSSVWVLALAVLSSTLLVGCPPEEGIDLSPEARFTATPRVGNVPLEVHFRDTSDPNEGTIYAWVWDFGDGTRSTAPNPSHTYNAPGEYRVTLTVTTSYGADTLVAERFVTAQTSVDFDEIDEEGGTAISKGMTLTVPEDVLEDTVAFGIRLGDGFSANIPELYAYLSNPVRMQHNGETERFYRLNGDDVTPSTLALEFNDTLLPVEDRTDQSKIMILCRTLDGVVFPIVGTVAGGRITVPVLNLPKDATYIVVYRGESYTERYDVNKGALEESPVTGITWIDYWDVYVSDAFLQQLAALDEGTIFTPQFYDNQDYDAGELSNTLDDVLAALDDIIFAYDSADARAPVLTQPNGAHSVIFFNMNDSDTYDAGFTRFEDVLYRSRMFGSIVIDPLQLITIARRNSQISLADLNNTHDLWQEMNFPNAFAQELFEAVFDGYNYPAIPVAPGVDLLDGLKRGISTYLGQRADGLTMPRSFVPEEAIQIGVPLFTPVLDDGKEEYGNANQDFFFWLENLLNTLKGGALAGLDLDILLDSDAVVDTPEIGVLENLRLALADAEDDDLSFEDLVKLIGGALDAGIDEKAGITLGELYKEFAQELGVENTDNAQIRPSDGFWRIEKTLQEDRFGGESVQVLEVDALDTPADINFILPPLSTIAVRVQIHHDADTLELTFNTDSWLENNGNSVAVTVYRDGVSGVELVAPDDNLDFTSFTVVDECTREVLVLISNINAEAYNFISVEGLATGTPGSGPAECSL